MGERVTTLEPREAKFRQFPCGLLSPWKQTRRVSLPPQRWALMLSVGTRHLLRFFLQYSGYNLPRLL
ncbi:hypothetical protein H671_4g11814 [Cricetulus griseus]|uniref:Uncharacterized protein n=1 Tax=Cricetulus griseus TaxID=10029 RepID=A0A061I820_CRIGR|nr:hypothetical protein H671_4g11814 [Cricetulus griseus]